MEHEEAISHGAAATSADAGADPSWQYYGETILEFETSGADCVVDLRRPLGDAAHAALKMCSLDRPFCVLTACDPRGKAAGSAENAARTRSLEAELRAKSLLLAHVTGRSTDGAHAEAGFACAITRTDGISIARRLEQSALFWFDGQCFWLVGAIVDTSDVALPARAPS